MIDVFPFAGYPVAVMGLGGSGLATARALLRSGAELYAWDDQPARRDAAAAEGIPIVDLAAFDFRRTTTLVLSPGIPHRHPKPHPVAARAIAAGCEIICDVELLARAQRDAAYIGVTGTNGKSTTTALIGHILKVTGREVEIGGNLGPPALSLEPLGASGTYVLEMSSYQLERTFSITFDIAVLLNITPDHLDRHGGMAGYIKAKAQIFHRQTAPRTAVIGVDDVPCRKLFEKLARKGEQVVIPVSGARAVKGGVYAAGGLLIDDSEGGAVPVLPLADLARLRGAHNHQNAAAAYAAAKTAGVSPPQIAAALRSFPGLRHRQELVAEIAGVAYVNDSKGTNADAAEKALTAYERIRWIAGGRAKEGGIAALARHFGRIRKAYLIGEAAEAFARTLGSVPHSLCGTLDRAVAEAAAEAEAGDTVLLSPACASWDQFASFEARGDAFRQMVEALAAGRPA